MTSPEPPPTAPQGGRRPAARLVSLASPAVILAGAAAAWFLGPATAGHRHAVLFAAAVCLAGSIVAWTVGLRSSRSAAGRVSVPLAALGLRLFPALAALAWLQAAGADLRAAGADRLLVFFYLAALAVDLVLIIMDAVVRPVRPRGDEAI